MNCSIIIRVDKKIEVIRMFQSISILFISRKYFYNKCNVNENLKNLKLKRKEKNRKIDI